MRREDSAVQDHVQRPVSSKVAVSHRFEGSSHASRASDMLGSR